MRLSKSDANRYFVRAKYPLAVVHKLLSHLDGVLGVGYDLGCSFEGMFHRSPLPAEIKQRFRSLVGIFHRHVHNQLCQLSELGCYMEGLGLEDLEGCERFFSGSNHLAAVV